MASRASRHTAWQTDRQSAQAKWIGAEVLVDLVARQVKAELEYEPETQLSFEQAQGGSVRSA